MLDILIFLLEFLKRFFCNCWGLIGLFTDLQQAISIQIHFPSTLFLSCRTVSMVRLTDFKTSSRYDFSNPFNLYPVMEPYPHPAFFCIQAASIWCSWSMSWWYAWRCSFSFSYFLSKLPPSGPPRQDYWSEKRRNKPVAMLNKTLQVLFYYFIKIMKN